MEKLTMNFEPCYMCANARVKIPLTDVSGLDNPADATSALSDENDSSIASVGYVAKGYQMHMYSGGGTPVHLDVTAWDNDNYKDIKLGCCYYPKFCPNCGRPLTEYDPDWTKYGITDLPFEVRYYIKAKGLLNLTLDPLMAVFDLFRWKLPDSAYYDEPSGIAMLDYMNRKYQVQVTPSFIHVIHNDHAMGLFGYARVEQCIEFLESLRAEDCSDSEDTQYFNR